MKAVTVTKQQYTSLNSAMVGNKFIVDEIQHGNLMTLFLATEDELNVLIPDAKPETTKSTAKPRRKYSPKFKKGMWVEWVDFAGRNLIGDVAQYKNRILTIVDVFDISNNGSVRMPGDEYRIDTREIQAKKAYC